MRQESGSDTRLNSKILVFYLTTFILSSVFYYLFYLSKSMEGIAGLYTLVFSWCPGIAGLSTQLIFNRSIRGLGWDKGKIIHLMQSYGLPFVYCLLIFSIVWVTGLGDFSFEQLNEAMQTEFHWKGNASAVSVIGYTILYCLLISLIGGFFVLGEEIGWRGFLVPILAQKVSFSKVALISGITWAIWHYPLFFYAEYNTMTPLWFGIPCTTISIVAISYVLAWFRLKSGSIWTAVLIHTSHNLFMQEVFPSLTVNTKYTKYIIGEFGIGLVLVALFLAFFFWKKRNQLAY